MPQDFNDDSEYDDQQNRLSDDQELPFLSINFVQQVDELVSLAHYGPSIVLVLGADGIGKTCTLEQLENETTDIGQIRIDGNPMLSIDQLHASFLQQLNNYEQAVEYNSVRDTLLRASEISEQLILVDDAQQLSTSVLESLISLVSPIEQSPAIPVRLFLFGNEDLKQQIKMDTFPQTAVYCLQLSGFEKEELPSFLAQQLNLSEDELEESFDSKSLSQLWKDSHGNPGQIIRSLVTDDVELEDVEEITTNPMAAIIFRSLLVLLGVSLLLLALFGEKWFGEKWLQSDSQAENNMGETVVEEINSSEQTNIEPQPQPQPQPAAAEAELVAAPIAKQNDSQIEEIIADNTPQKNLDISEQTITDDSVQETATDVIPVLVEDNSQTSSELSQIIENTDTTSPEAAIDFTTHESYLLDQPSSHYSVQLLGLSNFQEMQKFSEQLLSSQPLYIYRSLLNGKPWFILVTGNYQNADSARAAKDNFNSNIKKLNPWIKSFAKIQLEIQKAADSR